MGEVLDDPLEGGFGSVVKTCSWSSSTGSCVESPAVGGAGAILNLGPGAVGCSSGRVPMLIHMRKSVTGPATPNMVAEDVSLPSANPFGNMNAPQPHILGMLSRSSPSSHDKILS